MMKKTGQEFPRLFALRNIRPTDGRNPFRVHRVHANDVLRRPRGRRVQRRRGRKLSEKRRENVLQRATETGHGLQTETQSVHRQRVSRFVDRAVYHA